jgi:hypothetical protein
LLTPIAWRPTARVFTPFPLRFEHEHVSETQSSRQPKNHASFRKLDSPHCSGFAHDCRAIMQDAAQPPSARA